MKTVFRNVIACKPRHADDPAAVSVSISVSPQRAHAQITSLMTIAEAREFAHEIARAADDAEMKLPQ
jgi:hypothetical protein